MNQPQKTMRTVGVHTPGGPDVLEIINVPVPVATGCDLLIKVHAAGINGADLREREGKYPVPTGAPNIMGLEVSGEIVAVGEACERFRPGDMVCALLIGGGYAEYACLLYTSPSPRDLSTSRMPSSA